MKLEVWLTIFLLLVFADVLTTMFALDLVLPGVDVFEGNLPMMLLLEANTKLALFFKFFLSIFFVVYLFLCFHHAKTDHSAGFIHGVTTSCTAMYLYVVMHNLMVIWLTI